MTHPHPARRAEPPSADAAQPPAGPDSSTAGLPRRQRDRAARVAAPPAALVTGCSSGIGRATAVRLHAAGFAVYATARRPETLAELAAAGIATLQLDVTDDESMTAVAGQVTQNHGAVSILVNNAGF